MWNDNEFNSTFSSPGANAKETKKNIIRQIVPVTGQTICMASQVENENSVFEFNHLRFHQVCFIGIIRNVIKRANDITYLIDDMTSPEINVKLQSEDADDIESEEPISNNSQNQFVENQYVKVFGILKQLQGQKCLQAFKIMPIKELNEVTHHMLECMNASIYLATKTTSGDNADMTMENPMKSSNTSTFRNLNATAFGGSINDQISQFVKQSKSSEGVHIREICNYFKNVPEGKIREALDFLSTEGHVYSTIDDEHFKTTDAM